MYLVIYLHTYTHLLTTRVKPRTLCNLPFLFLINMQVSVIWHYNFRDDQLQNFIIYHIPIYILKLYFVSKTGRQIRLKVTNNSAIGSKIQKKRKICTWIRTQGTYFPRSILLKPLEALVFIKWLNLPMYDISVTLKYC